MESYQYSWIPGVIAPDALLEECSELYSSHYGNWSEGADRVGEPIRLSASRLRTWTGDTDVSLALARQRGALVGYAIVLQARIDKFGIVSWVTQFVVHREHRNRGVGQKLLFAAWGISDHVAWGITTSNPYAVRALEKATRRRCSPARILKNRRRLQRLGAERVPYLAAETVYEISESRSRVDTRFLVDHSNLEQKLGNATAPDKPWVLGELLSGWEWFAFCFRDQEQIKLTRSEIEAMLNASDDITREAYGRMQITEHPWARHAQREAGWIREYCRIREGDSVLDLGCGGGRHSIVLATEGFEVLGIDYSSTLIDGARKNHREAGLSNLSYAVEDCRELRLNRHFSSVVCLYDVVGTYADDEQNARLLETIRHHLAPGGRALISVMNGVLTRRLATRFFDLAGNPDSLLELDASGTMQESGDIFDPDHFLLETSTGVVYRKERFDRDRQLPAELIVRDRRYSIDEICSLCRAAGLDVIWARPVRAGQWDVELPETDDRAKEILVLCERPRTR